ncbi:FAD binding domain-containing protein [Fodinicurvata halophila]|uniref:FAD binding domain-containing protein n=1 Tax=Fodinicurvata halophila TaxID=1419723 RepID=A0ABV8UJR1_9PROT
MYDFEYHRPNSVDDAVRARGGSEDATFLAGGMTLLPTMKQRLANPTDLVDIGAIRDLSGISEENGRIVIGAMSTHASVAGNDLVKQKIPALANLARGIGDPQVRNRGTLGGSIANADPSADYPAAVLGLGATVKTDKREIKGDDFFIDMFETALEEGELILSVGFPIPTKAAYAKFPNPASRYAMVGVFVAEVNGEIRVAVTGAAPSAFRVPDMEEALRNNFSAEAVNNVKVPADGLNSDLHGSADYRAHLVTVMARRAVQQLA